MGKINEIWKKIDGFDGYEVSNMGNVRSNKSGDWCILKPGNNNGYFHVNLHKNEKKHSKKVHRLVASVFVPGYEDGLEVDHLDGNKSNNKASNLEWVTHKENIHRGHKNGLFDKFLELSKSRGKDHPKSKEFKVIDQDGNVSYYFTTRAISEALGLNENNIRVSIHDKHICDVYRISRVEDPVYSGPVKVWDLNNNTYIFKDINDVANRLHTIPSVIEFYLNSQYRYCGYKFRSTDESPTLENEEE